MPDLENWDIEELTEYINDYGGNVPDRDQDTDDDDYIDELKQEAEEVRSNQACESVLSIEKTIVYSVCLSWGGPADYIELDYDGEGWTGGRYRFQDWFDGAQGPEFTASEAEQWAEVFAIYPECER